jgi:hypothetical protein
MDKFKHNVNKKIGVGYILGDFFTNSSGHPGARGQFFNTRVGANLRLGVCVAYSTGAILHLARIFP